jgi:hypothetical protein
VRPRKRSSLNKTVEKIKCLVSLYCDSLLKDCHLRLSSSIQASGRPRRNAAGEVSRLSISIIASVEKWAVTASYPKKRGVARFAVEF